MSIILKIVFFVVVATSTLLIKSTNSKECPRRFLLIRDKNLDQDVLSRFSILDSNEKQYLYRLKSSSGSNDELQLISYPSVNLHGYLRDQQINQTLNLCFETLNITTNQWLNGTIQKIFDLFTENYLVQWNNEFFSRKKLFFSMYHKFYDDKKNVLAQSQMLFR